MALMHLRFPRALRNVEDPLFERGIDTCHETVRLWWKRFGPLFARDTATEVLPSKRNSPDHW